MISEPELELSMSNSNRYKSHSEGSDRHLNEPVQTVLHSVQRQGLGNVSSNTTRSDELLAHPQKVPQRGGNSEILQWMQSTVIQALNQNDKEYHSKRREASKEEAPIASTRNLKPTNLPKKGRRTRKIIGGNHIPQGTGFQKSQKMPWTMSSTWTEI
ncbi:hypothetical protein O181_118074 [Austropuccinia psidii MF-1]|uniref:Uncharacterized protein n=1 Tax=Austropuccinia psidii MF-1 TaxID=1389203 RepID=A0A9Q3PY45_9BASI|nr:hypothetical protein [Austropuccinia psidii MF-1]